MLEYAGIPAVALIMGISEVLKKQGFNPKFLPVVNVGLGLLAGIALNLDDVTKGIFIGLAVGLSAIGLYSGPKNVSEGMRHK